MDPFNDKGQFSQAPYAAPAGFSRFRFPWTPAALLFIMTLICFLLMQGYVALPGLYFWFIGGDLMQFWFIVLAVLGILYWRALPGARKKNIKRRSIQNSPSFMNDFPGNFGSFSTQQTRRASPSLILRLPLALLLVFLVYYFFIQGYTFRMNSHPTVMGDCNAGSITVQGNATSPKLHFCN